MTGLNGNRPENKDSGSGRGLGDCCKSKEQSTDKYRLGQGMKKRRKAGIIENRNQQNN